MPLKNNYRSINNILINSLKRNNKKSITKQKNQFKSAIKLYKKRMTKNASRFLKVSTTDDLTKSFLNTVDTIEKKVVKWIENGKIVNSKELKHQIDGLIQRSREYHIQLARREKDAKVIENSDSKSKYGYRWRATALLKTGKHHPDCISRMEQFQRQGYVTKKTALEETNNLPSNPYCECEYYKLERDN